MKTHPHPDFRLRGPREPRQRELRIDRSLNGASRALEGDKKAIASRFNLPSARGRKRLAQKPRVISSDSGKGALAEAPLVPRRWNGLRRLSGFRWS
jgi:hypothetical protein